MFTLAFWKGLAERALKTFVQSTLAALMATVVGATTAWEVSWLDSGYDALGIGLLATFLSVATSLGNTDFVAGEPVAIVENIVVPESPAPVEDDDEELVDDDTGEEPLGSEDFDEEPVR